MIDNNSSGIPSLPNVNMVDVNKDYVPSSNQNSVSNGNTTAKVIPTLPNVYDKRDVNKDYYDSSSAPLNIYNTAYNEYDKYIHGANYQLGGLDEMRAQNQGGWERTGRSFAQLGGTILGQLIAGSGSTINLIGNPVDTGKVLFGDDSVDAYKNARDGVLGVIGSALEQSGMAIQNGIEKAMPIYQTRVAQEGGWGKFGDSSWWATMFPTVGSAMASFVPVLGAMKGLNIAAGLLREANIATRRASTLLNIGADIGRGFVNSRVAQTLASTLFSTHLDVMQEVANQYDSERKYGKDTLGLSNEEADKYAADWAASSYRKGFMVTGLFELAEMHILLNNGKFVNRFMNENLEKSAGKWITKATTIEGGELGKAGAEITTSVIPKSLLATTGEVAKTMITEGGQEIAVDIALAEGKRDARMNAGFEEFSSSSIGDRIAQHLSKGSNWDSGIWGAIGGITMIAGRGTIQKTLYKTAADQELELIKKNLDSLQTTGETLAKFTDNATDPFQKSIDRLSILRPIVRNAASRGTMSMTNKFVDALVKLDGSSAEDLKTLGFTQDSIEAAKQLQKELAIAEKIYQKSYSKTFDKNDDKINELLQDVHADVSYALDYYTREGKTISDELVSKQQEIINDLNLIRESNLSLPSLITTKSSETKQARYKLNNAKGRVTVHTKNIAALTEQIASNEAQINALWQPGKKGRKPNAYHALVAVNIRLNSVLDDTKSKLETAIAKRDSYQLVHEAANTELNELKKTASENDLKLAFDNTEAIKAENNVDIAKLEYLRDKYHTEGLIHSETLTQLKSETSIQKLIDEIKADKAKAIENDTDYYKGIIAAASNNEILLTAVANAKAAGIDMTKEAETRRAILVFEAKRRAEAAALSGESSTEELEDSDEIQARDSLNYGYSRDKQTGELLSAEVATKTPVRIGDTVAAFDVNPDENGRIFEVKGFKLDSESSQVKLILDVNGKEELRSVYKYYKEGEVAPTKIDTNADNTDRIELEARIADLLKTPDPVKIRELLNDPNIALILKNVKSVEDAIAKNKLIIQIGELANKLKITDYASEDLYKDETDRLIKEYKIISDKIKYEYAKATLNSPIRTLVFNSVLTGIEDAGVRAYYFRIMDDVIAQLANAYRYENGRFILWNENRSVDGTTLHEIIQDQIKELTSKINKIETGNSAGIAEYLLNDYIKLSAELNKSIDKTLELRRELIAISKAKEISDLTLVGKGFVKYLTDKNVDKSIIDKIENLVKKLNQLNKNQGDTIGSISIVSVNSIKELYNELINTLTVEQQANTGFLIIQNQYNVLINLYNQIDIINKSDGNIDEIEEAIFTEHYKKMHNIFNIMGVERDTSIADLVNRSIELDSFGLNAFVDYSKELVDSGKASSDVTLILNELQNVLFENVNSGLEAIEEIIQTYRALTGNNSTTIHFDNLLSILEYGDISGESVLDNKWLELYDSIKLIQNTFLTKDFMTYMKRTLDNMNKSSEQYAQLYNDYQVLNTLKDALEPLPSREDYNTEAEKNKFFTDNGDIKYAYLEEWRRNSPGNLHIQVKHAGTPTKITIIKTLTDPKVFDKSKSQYSVDTIKVGDEEFTPAEIYDALGKLQKDSNVFVDLRGLDFDDPTATIATFVWVGTRKLLIGEIQASDARIGIHKDSNPSEGIPLIKNIHGSLVFDNYLTDLVNTNKAIDSIATKGIFDMLRQFYKEYTDHQQTDNHNHKRYEQLFNQLKEVGIHKTNNGEHVFNWFLKATGEDITTATELNAHKVAAILAPIFYSIPSNMIESFQPNANNIKNRFNRYSKKLEDTFKDSKTIKRFLKSQQGAIDIQSLFVAHISKPSVNFADDNSVANIISDEVIPNLIINGIAEHQIVSIAKITIDGTRESPVSDVTQQQPISFESSALQDEVRNRDKSLFTTVQMFGGEEGRSFIPLRTATIGMFKSDKRNQTTASEYSSKSTQFIVDKMLELLDSEFANEKTATRTDKNGLLEVYGTGEYVINPEANEADQYTTKDILDDMSEVIAMDNSDKSITASALEGKNVYFKFFKQFHEKGTPTHSATSSKIEFRTTNDNGVVTFHQITKTVYTDRSGKDNPGVKYVYKTVGTRSKLIKGVRTNVAKTTASKTYKKTFIDKITGKSVTTNEPGTEQLPNWVIVHSSSDPTAIIRKLTINNNGKPSVIQNIIRTVPLQTDTTTRSKQYKVKAQGKSIGKTLTNSKEISEPYTSVVDGKTYRNFQDFLIKTGAVYSNVQGVRDVNGNIISNYTLTGKYPPVINVSSHLAAETDNNIDSLRKVQGDGLIGKLINNTNSIADQLEINNPLITKFLQNILDNHGDMAYQYMETYNDFKRFELSRGVPENLIPLETSQEYRNMNAYISSNPKTISILSNIKSRQNANSRIKLELFHELLHSTIKGTIDPDTVAKNQIIEYMDGLEARIATSDYKLTANDRTLLDSWIHNVGIDYEEFVTYPFTYAPLVELLNKITYKDEVKTRSIWDDILDFIVRVLTGNTINEASELALIRQTVAKIINNESISGNQTTSSETNTPTGTPANTPTGTPTNTVTKGNRKPLGKNIKNTKPTGSNNSIELINSTDIKEDGTTKININNPLNILKYTRIFKDQYIDSNNLKIC